MIKIILLVLSAEICAGVGQMLFKKSTNSIAPGNIGSVSDYVRFFTKVLSKPSIWAGLIFVTMGISIWLTALAQGDLSLVFPLGSVQYILILFVAHFFLGEKIDKMKLTGTLLVVAGVILVAMS